MAGNRGIQVLVSFPDRSILVGRQPLFYNLDTTYWGFLELPTSANLMSSFSCQRHIRLPFLTHWGHPHYHGNAARCQVHRLVQRIPGRLLRWSGVQVQLVWRITPRAFISQKCFSSWLKNTESARATKITLEDSTLVPTSKCSTLC